MQRDQYPGVKGIGHQIRKTN